MKQYIVAILLTLLTSPGCKKYLDEKPDQSLVVPNTLKGLQALLDNNGSLNKNNPSWGMASSDDYFLTADVYNSRSVQQKLAYIWGLKDYSTFPNEWAKIYNQVYIANVVLEGIGSIPKDISNKNDWENIHASALVYRAQSFFRAVLLFSKAYNEQTAHNDLGIVLRLTSDYNERSARASIFDSYAKIVNDLKEAAIFLPNIPITVLRPSKPAAYGLLARTYLAMAEYDSAWKYSDLSLQINNQLLDYNDLDVNASFPFQPFNKEVIFHSTVGSYIFSNVSPNNARIDTTLFGLYDNNDLRKLLFFRLRAVPNIYSFKGNYNGNTDLFVGIANDELFLTRAECYARKGNKDAAIADLNFLLLKRWKAGTFNPLSAGSANEALSIILSERRKELIFRDLRWMDIKRLNREGANIVLKRIVLGQEYTLLPNENRYALQLPADIISMTGMPQNP
ncbi:MAG: RagB/SusD family nutrient uptake outer membrane protein [Sphingobacteriales bacterium]|nr:RagB/SusD family nutrient uptake outer membrane protein [Sphingobacteriales bacterium]OJW04031.1 MAG: hypothetical protein BGO52_18000 [Sphingobacteriales bacterium 44-61]